LGSALGFNGVLLRQQTASPEGAEVYGKTWLRLRAGFRFFRQGLEKAFQNLIHDVNKQWGIFGLSL
jgi:hypothetical protein